MSIPFEKDPNHWLWRLSPEEWIRAALGELARAEQAFSAHNARAAIAGCKRAAGMSLNAALIVEPNEAWGRSYVDHLAALARDETVPQALRDACTTVLDARPPSGSVVALRRPSAERNIVEGAHDVIAHAYAVMERHEPPES